MKEEIIYLRKKLHNLEKDYENIEYACDKLQEQLNKKQKIIDKAKTKSIELQNKYGYILDDLIFLLDILGGVDNE